MKKEISQKPEKIVEQWAGELDVFPWQDLVTSIPSPLVAVTSYKSNGKENACMQSYISFTGDSGEFICILSSVSKTGHLYRTLKETGCCVINFPSKDINDKCMKTIDNNGFENQEITDSGLTAEKAVSVNAPRIAECFLNIECEVLWEREHFEGCGSVVIALKAKHICMDDERYDESKLGRYGKTGYMLSLSSQRNPETGESTEKWFGTVEI